MNNFTYKIFDACSKTEENFSFSPLSLVMLLTLLLEGSEGETQERILKLLASDSVGHHREKISQFLHSIDSNFKVGDFELLNTIEHGNLLGVQEAFLSKLDRRIRPTVKLRKFNPIDFKIINKINIKENWSKPFADIEAKTDVFTLQNGEEVETFFMYQSNISGWNEVQYMREDIFHAIRIPTKDVNICFEVFLPFQHDGVDDLIDILNENKILNLVDKFEEIERIEVVLPKFKIDSNLSFQQLSAQLKLEKIFEPTWDYKSLFESPDKISIIDIIQNNFIDVNEFGIEMRSLTMAYGIGSSPQFGSYIVFEANHPFLFLVRDLSTNTILQLGKFGKPQAVKLKMNKARKLRNKQLNIIRKVKHEALHITLRGLAYFSLICLNKLVKKYDYQPTELDNWFRDVTNLLTKDLPSSDEIQKLSFWVDEDYGFPYNSEYIIKKDFIAIQKKYPKISTTVEELSYLINKFVDDFYYPSIVLRAFETTLRELIINDIELPNLDEIRKYSTIDDDKIGKTIDINYELIDRLMV